MLARFGFSSKLVYGLFIQSILVIFATIVSVWGIFSMINDVYSLRFITNFISTILCIDLLLYSFYGFNNEKYQEFFFSAAVVLYIILIVFGLFTSSVDFKNPISLLTVITLVSAIFFFHDYKKSYQSANFAMLVVIITGMIVVLFDVWGGMPWIPALKYIIIPFTIGLTYFERVQRGKYMF